MIKPKVLIASRISKEAEAYIGTYCDYERWEGPRQIPQEVLFEKLQDKEGAILTGIPVNEELLSHAPKLRVASNVSVGYNNFDIKAMKARGIIGTNTPGVLENTVADLVMGLMLATARRISELDHYVKAGRWKREDNKNLFGLDVYGTTLGIIGMGRIGEAIAKRAKFGFDMEVRYYNRTRKYEAEKHLGVVYSDFETLLKTSDFVVLIVPLTEDTYHMIGTKEFALMKESAFFINASRGQTVDEEALIRALENKELLGAGLDVFETEPVQPDNPLLRLPNVITVPHIGSSTEKTRRCMAMTAAKNLVAALQGDITDSCVPELRRKGSR
ncbi:2-hydroxyacid dehydrogenase [Cellulosilyticum sp. I15G10I2]|uniref:2-hydroxyacid dehydrogenase n=1 Tax=Cellulosilyticum sp. I15G10I2 TaxID=1892843 RepID=UPI000AA55316|nr:D-glycerate dehydrogenase [Cellulosilyticum sp. I15G10I2]